MGLNNNNSVEKSGAKARRSIYNLVLIVVVGVLFVTGYTYILQKMYNDSILDNAIAEDSSRTTLCTRAYRMHLPERILPK